MRKIIKSNNASIWPIAIFIIVLAIASVLILLYGHVLEPFLNLMDSGDDSISESVSYPRSLMSQFAQIIWPKGLLLAIFIGTSAAVLMEYQKAKYKET